MFQDSATPDPGEYDKIPCGICGTDMNVSRNVNGATSFAEALSKRSHLHDSFKCPHIDEDWHRQVKFIREEANKISSQKITEIMLNEADEILKTRVATKKISRYKF